MPVTIAKRAFPGDPQHCGDECAYWHSGGKTTLCVVDGLGHGEQAQRAAQAAVDYVAHHLAQPLVDIFAGCDLALRRTRGVAMGIAVIIVGGGKDEDENENKDAGTLTYAGIGNTRAMIVRSEHPIVQLDDNYDIVRRASNIQHPVPSTVVRLSSNYGIVGGGYGRLSPETAPLGPGDLVVLYTDGIPELMDILDYDAALRADVGQLAEKILQDWGRGTDDAAVLVFKSEAP